MPDAASLRFADVERLLDSVDLNSVSAIRNRALVAVLAFGGLRVSTVLALREADFAPSFDRVWIRTEATKREVELLDRAPEELTRWAAERPALALPDDKPFFCTMRGGQLASSYLRELMSRLVDKAGLGISVSAESLRRAHARELRRRGWSLRRIQVQLGHGTPATTRRYLLRADQEAKPRGHQSRAVAPPQSDRVIGMDVKPLLRSIIRSGPCMASLLRAIRTDEGLLADLVIVAVERARESGIELETGHSDAALAGLHPLQIAMPGLERVELMQACDAALKTGTSRTFETSVTIGAEIRRVVVEVAPVGSDDVFLLAGAPGGQTRSSWAGSWTALWEEADTALLGLDAQMSVARGNRAARVLLGIRWADVFGARPPFGFLGGLSEAAIRQAAGGAAVSGSFSGVADGQDERDVEIRVFDLWPPLGPVRYVLAISETARRAGSERDLKTLLAAYQSVAENSPEHIVRFDRDGHLLQANRGFRFDLGAGGPSELLGWWERSSSPRFDPLTRAVEGVVRTGGRSTCTIDVEVRDSPRTYEWLLSAERAPDGVITHVIGFGRDTTKRDAAERRVRRQLVLQSALARIGQVASTATPQAYELLCEEAVGILGVDVVALVSHDGTDGGLVKGIWPSEPWGQVPGALWRRAAGATDTTFPRPVPDIWNSDVADISADALESLRGMRFAAIPVAVSGDGWGVLLAGAVRSQPFAAWDEAAAMSLGEAAAGIVRLGRVRSRAASQAALARLALVEPGARGVQTVRNALAKEAADLLGAEHGMLLEVAGDEARVTARWIAATLPQPAELGDTVSAAGKCAAAGTLRTGRTTFLADVVGIDDVHTRRLARAGLRSALSTPLTDQGSPWGLLCVASTQVAAFDEDSLLTLSEFALLAGHWAVR